MTEQNTIDNTKGNGRAKKAGAVLAGAVLLGAAGLATTANWTDEEAVAADFASGSFNLQIAVDQDGEGEWIWLDSEDADYTAASGADLGFTDNAWGPGQTETQTFAVQLEPGTTHEAAVDATVTEDAGFSDNFSLAQDTENTTFVPGEVYEYTTAVTSDSGNEFEQGLSGEGFFIEFDATSADLSADGGEEPVVD